ncbi:MAG: DoxX family membrane protein [Armatimonadetes bacterium]|nr:DoxX family membrane protein [Armatimonadota bacterium]
MKSRSISRIFSSRGLAVVCRVVVAGVFIYAAVGKIQDPAEFADAVMGFRILPLQFVNIFAIILPWVELIGGVCLLSGVLVTSSALLLVALNVMFMFAVGSAMARGLDIECGCFTLSQAHAKVGWSLLARDVAIILLCLPLLSGIAGREGKSKEQQAMSDEQ